MPRQSSRLLELINYVQQTARLGSRIVSDIEVYQPNLWREDDFFDLPGFEFNLAETEEEGGIWLRVHRLRETPAPVPDAPLLRVWLIPSNDPGTSPSLRASVTVDSLAALPEAFVLPKKLPSDYDRLLLTDFTGRAQVLAAFDQYHAEKWLPWAGEEKKTRKTIGMYSRLFALQQQLEMGAGEKPLELLWGVGMALVHRPKAAVDIRHPLLVRGVELSINSKSLAIEVRPRAVPAQVELRCFSETEFPNVLEVEKTGKSIYSQEGEEFTPFERATFAPLLQAAVAQLDPRGTYLPDRVNSQNRLLPTASTDLQVTDTWVLFARPRGVGLLTEDLERFKAQLNIRPDAKLPAAVLALVTEPAEIQSDVKPLPSYRGLSLVGSQTAKDGEQGVRELYFPLPFNDEQVQIIQRLDVHNGVVVQGPPGTGKTHTIANIICHYMALGKRVLVTSLKDQALGVVQDKLPPEIRQLTVSLLTSEADGLKQFEHAITTLAAGIQSTNRGASEQEIVRFTEELNRLHAAIARIDRELADWAARNTDPITVHGETLSPLEAAEEVIGGMGLYEWFPDELTIDAEHDPRFTEDDIKVLRKARQELGPDLDYLGCKLPSFTKMPAPKRTGELHAQIKQLEHLLAGTDTLGMPSWSPQCTGDEEVFRNLLQLLLGLQEEQSRLLSGPEWVKAWLGPAQIEYASCQTALQSLPHTLPDVHQLSQLHLQLVQYHELQAELVASSTPALSVEGNASAEELQGLISELSTLQTVQEQLKASADWVWPYVLRYRSQAQSAEFDLFQELGTDIGNAQTKNEAYLRRPVQGTDGFVPGSELLAAIDNLAAGRPPFGRLGQFVPFGNKKEKAQLDGVRILVSPPRSPQDWEHVRGYVALQQHIQELLMRWQLLAPRLGLPGAEELGSMRAVCGRCREITAYMERETRARAVLCRALPGWSVGGTLDEAQVLAEAVRVAKSHLSRISLRDAGVVRDTTLGALEGTEGNISRALHLLLRDQVGQRASDAVMLHKTWGDLLSEVQQVHMSEAAYTTREAAARERVVSTFPLWPESLPLHSPMLLAEAIRVVQRYLLAASLTVGVEVEDALRGTDGSISQLLQQFISNDFGKASWAATEAAGKWAGLLDELRRVEGLFPQLETVSNVAKIIAKSGAPYWAEWLRISPRKTGTISDELLPTTWLKAWRLKRLENFVNGIDARAAVRDLTRQRQEATTDLARVYQKLIAVRTWHRLAENATPAVRSALQAFLAATARIGKTGRGKKANAARGQARQAADLAQPAIPCWILPHYRVSEALPTEFGSFDLVIIDEASQSDLSALPALLRAKKLLVVGDDKQVSPAAVGMNLEEVQNLMLRTLPDAVEVFKPLFSPDRSIYDLCKVVFADTALMLREHFRCVSPIIEYSKREYYGHELRPLRFPKASERLDPPLVDVLVVDGFRRLDINPAEAKFIVDEICKITQTPGMAHRTIGVISLTKNTQAYYIWEELQRKLAPDVLLRHRIACGDAATFQGNERDIVFLSMLVSKDQAHALSGKMYEQRFNVAASRARDRMYLVRSMQFEELSPKDIRRSLVAHFQAPFQQEEALLVADRRSLCESNFEREIFDELVTRGYRVRPQVRVGSYRIDMVVEGDNDERLAIECDGDRYHGPEHWEADMRRQRILERAGWQFWRCFASTFVRYRDDVIKNLERTLQARGIAPITTEEMPPESSFVEFRRVVAFEPVPVDLVE